MSQTGPNPAFRAALERAIDGERVALARALAFIRLGVGVLAIGVGVQALLSPDRTRLLPSVVVSFAYAGAGVVVWQLIVRGRLVRRAGWVIPLLDVPLIAATQLVQTAQLREPWMGMVNTTAMMSAFVVISALSLSRSAVLLTVAIGLVPMLYRAWFVKLAPVPLAMTLISYGGLAISLVILVGRIRGLVHSTRAQDLLGKYLLGKRLGSGGMAEVFEATYSPEGGFERKVAVKRILPSYMANKDAIALFRREAEIGALLAHPGVVQVLDFGTHGDTCFLAMEFIDGVSLRDAMRVPEPLPLVAVVHLATQLADALDYIHTRVSQTGTALGLVHRDLNPPNVMLTRGGDVKLADFGIALVAGRERITATGVMRGKLGYAAPEQLLGQPYDGRADLFALGVTLHECLTGAHLFVGTNELELIKQCLHADIPAPSAKNPAVPPELDGIVLGLLERDPARRTPSGAELRRALLGLPRVLQDVQEGRRLVAQRVARARESLVVTGPAVLASAGAMDEVTKTSGTVLPSERPPSP